MRGLKHFGRYNIKVVACREPIPIYGDVDPCSKETMKTAQTIKKEGADNILTNTVELNKIYNNDSTIDLKASWKEPLDPNGVVLAYQIDYKLVGHVVRIFTSIIST